MIYDAYDSEDDEKERAKRIKDALSKLKGGVVEPRKV